METGSIIGIIIYLAIQLGLVILAESSAQSYLKNPDKARIQDRPIYVVPVAEEKELAPRLAWAGFQPRLTASLRRLLP